MNATPALKLLAHVGWLARTAGLVLATLLAGCSKPSPVVAPPVEADPLTTVAPEQVFKGSLAGKPVHLVVYECKVFRALPDQGGWQMVLEPEPYPFFTSCERESLEETGGSITVRLGRMAFGAGGCCATGGTYRSTDGVLWKKL